MESEEIRTDDCVVIGGSQAALSELVEALQSDDEIKPAVIEYENPEIPGQAGEPVTIAILILVGKAIVTGGAAEAGRRSAGAIWDKVAKWHKKHAASAKFAIRDAADIDRPSDWEEVARIIKPKPRPRRRRKT